jgi:two-component system, NarL family, invasion response regulator UvrY
MQRILIADDHSIVRYGLNMILQKHFHNYTLDEAWDAETVMGNMKQHSYALILLDLSMPDTDPSVLLHWIKNFHKETKVLVISMNEETLFGMRAIQLGAHGYIKKDAAPEEIIKAMQSVLSGKKYVSRELANAILDSTLDGKSVNPFERLSPREFQVAMYMVQDYSQKQISEMLQIQYATVNTFKQRIYEKLSVEHRKDLVQLAAAYSFAGK